MVSNCRFARDANVLLILQEKCNFVKAFLAFARVTERNLSAKCCVFPKELQVLSEFFVNFACSCAPTLASRRRTQYTVYKKKFGKK